MAPRISTRLGLRVPMRKLTSPRPPHPLSPSWLFFIRHCMAGPRLNILRQCSGKVPEKPSPGAISQALKTTCRRRWLGVVQTKQLKT